MEIFQPQNFFQMAGLFGGVFAGLIALLSLRIATSTLKVATEAKDEWRRQKNFEIDIDGYASTLDAMKLLEDLRLDQYDIDLVKDHSSSILTDIYTKGEQEVYKSYVNLYSYIAYYQKLKHRIFEIRKKSLTILNISEDQELINFYHDVISLESSLFSIHHNYHVSIINRFVETHNYVGIVKENYAVCLYFNNLRNSIPASEASDEEIYKTLYERFFTVTDKDWLEPLRSRHIRFYFRKLHIKPGA